MTQERNQMGLSQNSIAIVYQQAEVMSSFSFQKSVLIFMMVRIRT
jgi:hypothetical protein